MSSSFYDRFSFHLRESSEKVAFIDQNRQLTFGELDLYAQRYATQLQRIGIRPGDRIAAFIPTSLELTIIWLGAYKLGAIHVPINTQYRATELAHILQDADVRIVVLDPNDDAKATFHEAYEQIGKKLPVLFCSPIDGDSKEFRMDLDLGSLVREEIFIPPKRKNTKSDEDIAMIIYTSGTTGKSKGVALSYRAIISGILSLTELWEWNSTDTLVLALPLFHVHGLGIGLHGTLLHGVRTILHRKFEAKRIIEAFRSQNASIFMGVPTMYHRILEWFINHPDDAEILSDGRLFTSGSAALPKADYNAFWRQTGHRIVERYGMTETMLTLSNPYRGKRKPGSVGIPIPGVEARIIDPKGEVCADNINGELQIRGQTLLSKYWGKNTPVTDENGWFSTGDIAFRNEDNYYTLLGRISVDILKSGGYKISAKEIEELLMQHESVLQVAVIGIPDQAWGQRVVAVITLKNKIDIEILDQYCRSNLADYKRPRSFVIREKLPRNVLGKIQKHILISELS